MHARASELLTRCDALGVMSETPENLTRTFLSPPMHDVHAALCDWMEAAGMAVRKDAVGNLFGRYEGLTEDAPALLIGSHLDTVKNAGRYDGALGVLTGLAAVEALEGKRLPFALEVVGFSEEEGVRFGLPFLGSRALTGSFEAGWLELTDDTGLSMREVIRNFGGEPGELAKSPPSPPLLRGRTVGFLEVHIEQGPKLAALGESVGVVEAVVGSSRALLTFKGRAGHAGTTPMAGRRDALAGAAAFVLEVEAYAAGFDGLVATVGRLTVEPGAINVIPGSVTLSLDVRHADDAVREEAVAALHKKAERVAAGRGLIVHWHPLMSQAATPLDKGLTRLLHKASGGAPVLPSGAGHDAQIVAAAVPAAMLFVRSPNGLSHHPDETVEVEDVAVALGVVMRFLDLLGARYAL